MICYINLFWLSINRYFETCITEEDPQIGNKLTCRFGVELFLSRRRTLLLLRSHGFRTEPAHGQFRYTAVTVCPHEE